MNNATENTRLYIAEVYTKNPETGEKGFDIEFVWMVAIDRKDCVRQLTAELCHFDTIIQLTQTNETRIGVEARILNSAIPFQVHSNACKQPH